MSDDVSVIKSRGRRDVLWAMVAIVAAIGGVFEYQQATMPLDEAIIFLSPVQTEPVVQKVIEPQPVTDDHRQALREFLDYMDEANDKANQLVSYEGSALSRIKGAPTVTETIKPDAHIFQDGKIEIYDSEKGVVDVVDTKAPANDDKVKPDVVEEQAKPDDTTEEATRLNEQEQAELIAQQQVQRQVEKDLQQVAENGDEAPVVLLPGVGVPPVAESEAEETIDLTKTVDDTTADMEKINRAMRQVEQLNIEGLVPEAPNSIRMSETQSEPAVVV